MSATSWFQLKYALTAVLSKSIRRPSSRRPVSSRPSLECLEERVVPDGASGNLGIVTNATVNFQSGITLIPNLPFVDLSGVAVGIFTSPFNASGALDLTQAGLNLPSNLPNFTQTAFGFGSGTQPGQPWVPNAYNLGLANNQTAYPSIADHGFQTPPPWIRQIAHIQEKNADNDPSEQLAPPRVFLAVKESVQDDNPATDISVGEDAGDPREERIDSDSDVALPPLPLVPHAATEANDTETADAVREAVVAGYVLSEDIAVEEAPLVGTWKASEAAAPDDESPFVESAASQDVPVLESLNLPSTLLLSVLTPAQMMALLMKFPAPNASADDCEEERPLDETE